MNGVRAGRRLSALLTTSLLAATPIPTPTGPTTLCTVRDKRAIELSGLLVTDSGYVSENDSNDDPSRILVFFLDKACKVTRTIGYPTAARDPEDLAQAPDGTIWTADIGDNLDQRADKRRKTIGLWKIVNNRPVPYRLHYPDGPHDAEALFFDNDGTPVIVTKELFGPAGIYIPTDPLVPNTSDGVGLTRIGDFTPSHTGTENPFGLVGDNMVTGAAVSRDRRHVALRTYADAYEWDVTGTLRQALTGKPRVTPLPDEPQGEGIAYTPAGDAFVTVSDRTAPTPLLRWPIERPAAARATVPPAPSAIPGKAPGKGNIRLIGAVGASLGVLAVVVLIRRRRPRR
jgi:hypothetical protein